MPASEAQAVTWDQAVLLAGIQALCISADQEWCRQEGKLSEFDKGWFTGQLHIFDLYTGVEKSAIAEARAYIEKLSATAAPVPASEAAKQRLPNANVVPPFAEPASQRDASDSNWLLSTVDGKDWTDEFCRLNKAADYGTMLAWFCNAIMTGYDTGRRHEAEEHARTAGAAKGGMTNDSTTNLAAPAAPTDKKD